MLFVGCAVGKMRIWDEIKTRWPFFIAAVVTQMLATYIPALSLWMPSLFH